MSKPTILACVLVAASFHSCWPVEGANSTASQLDERVLVVHIDEGQVVRHRLGEARERERVELIPFNAANATMPRDWSVTGPGLPAEGIRPLRIGRKSKGTDFAWMIQSWDQAAGRAVNRDPDHAKEHWLYLVMPHPLKAGEHRISGPLPGGMPAGLPLVVQTGPDAASEAIHVNQVGYLPDGPKYAYLFHWAGDLGGIDFTAPARAFRVRSIADGSVAFQGAVELRAPADQAETGQGTDTPGGNFQGAPVWQCDFSALRQPGGYRVEIDGVGVSLPIRIAADAYREAHRTVARALYHQRSGIELDPAHTRWTRPAPHHPKLTPGFAGRLVYTRSRMIDWSEWEGRKVDRPAIDAAVCGPLDEAWGWYQDAADWDGYYHHMQIASLLLFAYETAPRNFADGDLGIPESGNGVPDIIDEAAWLPRWGHRVRQALISHGWGSGGIGLRVTGDLWGEDNPGGIARGSWQDTDRTWVVSGEDPWSTYLYAGAAAHLAYALRLVDRPDPQGVDWRREAVEAYAWARNNTQSADESRKTDVRLADPRRYAAAALHRLTGDAVYEQQYREDIAGMEPGQGLSRDRAMGPWIHALGGGAERDRDLTERSVAIVLGSCRANVTGTASRRALRWGGDWFMPMLIGHQTTPQVFEAVVGCTLARDRDPGFAAELRAAAITSSDFVLGANALNLVWVTGLGQRPVRDIFMLSEHNSVGTPVPGLIPYGPWRKAKDLGQGPWDWDWPNQTVYPPIDAWPGNERWFSNRCAPMSSEYTIWQNLAPSAALWGWLSGPP